ncbi:MAG: hypothetical protein OEV08_13030 [Nitrospira sp.]|nr:hypothetical protein [Nitrospira sp.]
MSLTNLHTISTHQIYVSLRDLEIKRAENDKLLDGLDLSGLGPKPDIFANSAFIGYGIDFRKNSIADIQAWYTQANLSAFLTPNDLTLLANYQTNPTSANRQALLNSFTHLPDEQAAARLLTAAVDARETQLNARLGFVMPESNERAALMSMFYNGGPGIIGSRLLNALQNDNRAEAWYEIRYGSNANGIYAPRRIAESNLFSLYDNPGQGVSEAEAKEVLRMYTIHQPEIQDYESHFGSLFPTGGTNTVVFQIIGAKTTLIPIYNAGKAIDGEVLVGNEFSNMLDEYGRLVLDKNDLLFGEGGNDYLHGHGGEDVLYGGTGVDRLYGVPVRITSLGGARTTTCTVVKGMTFSKVVKASIPTTSTA